MKQTLLILLLVPALAMSLLAGSNGGTYVILYGADAADKVDYQADVLVPESAQCAAGDVTYAGGIGAGSPLEYPIIIYNSGDPLGLLVFDWGIDAAHLGPNGETCPSYYDLGSINDQFCAAYCTQTLGRRTIRVRHYVRPIADVDYYQPPAPLVTCDGQAIPTGSALSIFNGRNPNGKWSLYVADKQADGHSGCITGWTLNITTCPSPGPSCTPTTSTFTNSAPITIPDSGLANPYPSTICVDGVNGTVTKVTVSLNELSHTFPSDIDILLVGAEGDPNENVVLMSSAGGGTEAQNVTLTFDDDAKEYLPNETGLESGTFKPTNLTLEPLTSHFPGPAGIPGKRYRAECYLWNFSATPPRWDLKWSQEWASSQQICEYKSACSPPRIAQCQLLGGKVCCAEAWWNLIENFGHSEESDCPTPCEGLGYLNQQVAFDDDPPRPLVIGQGTRFQFDCSSGLNPCVQYVGLGCPGRWCTLFLKPTATSWIVGNPSTPTGYPTLGQAGKFTLFAMKNPNNQTANLSGSTVTGDVAAASGVTLKLNSGSTINGNVYIASGATFQNNGTVNGTVYTGQDLAQARQDAINAGTNAAALAPNFTYNTNINTNTTVNGNSGLNVVKINGDINLNNTNKLTLNGPADAFFVVNVTGKITLNNTAAIVAGGAMQPSHLFINMTGSGGGLLSTKAGNVIQGTLLGSKVGGGTVLGTFGTVILGQNFTLGSGAKASFASHLVCPP